MRELTELYDQVQQVAALAGDNLCVALSASVNTNGPYFTVNVTAPAFASPGDVLGPQVGHVSATQPDVLLAKLAHNLRVQNPYAVVQYATANQRHLLGKLLAHPAVRPAHKARVSQILHTLDVAQADAEMENLVRVIDEADESLQEASTAQAA